MIKNYINTCIINNIINNDKNYMLSLENNIKKIERGLLNGLI